MTGKMLYIHAISAVHSGTGQGIGYIDQPVARDRTTGWPILPGSSIKGVLRSRGEDIDAAMAKVVFGPKTDKAHEHAGAILFPDAHLVALPVRSLYGSFAWITSPLVLRHWRRDRVGLGGTVPDLPELDLDPNSLDALVSSTSVLGQDDTVYLEDYDLHAKPSPGVDQIATAIASAAFSDQGWRDIFQQRLVVTTDFVFQQFAATSLEVTARIRLQEETKTVARGGLWYEESVPAESVFAAPLLLGEVKIGKVHPGVTEGDLWNHLRSITGETMLQVGGNASVGKGLVQCVLEPDAATPQPAAANPQGVAP